MNCILELENLEYHYPNGPKALDRVGLRLIQGEKIALVGPNGAGKSTLLLMLNGMLKPDSGTVRFHGKPISYKRKELINLRKKVGFVFQNPDHQIIAPTVFQDVAFGPANLDYTEKEIKESVSQALMYVGLTGFERRPPHNLSGGEKKKVAMAGILAMNPDVLVFDEPTSALDPDSARSIMELLDELHHSGKTIVISTHDVELAYTWADRIILMNQGKIIICSKPGEAFSDKNLLRDSKLSKPVLLELYDSLRELGMTESEKLPKSVLDFIHVLESGVTDFISYETCGTIFLVDAEHINSESLRSFIDNEVVEAVGGMGSFAKKTADEYSVHLTYTYGVIDKCLLKAIAGKNSLIITTGGMIQRVHDRVEEFNRESGNAVPIVGFDEWDQHQENKVTETISAHEMCCEIPARMDGKGTL